MGMPKANPTPPLSHPRRESIDPSAVMRIKHLQLRAKTVVEGFFNGLHRSPLHGSSVEFSEYRPYSVGDDLRGLDWKRFARSDRYFIKKFEDETSRRCYLVVDQSQSMGYGSLEYTKINYARTLAATFAYFLTLQRDSVGVMTFDEAVADFIPARRRPGHLHQMLGVLSRPLSGKGTDIDAPLKQIASLVGRRGLVILISDLLTPVDSLRTNLAYLRSRGHEVGILRILDPTEVNFQLDSPSMVIDMETGREIYLDPDAARDDYQKAFQQHQEQLQTVCDSLAVDLYPIVTNQPLDDSLFHLVQSQQRRTRPTARAGMLSRSASSRGAT
ncbi:VWA domain containing CoxE-like protein [Planctomycetes bacterium CA13]|uniref:VWA domain containing CoxE-like protein n=1 Tax=Novipirellula herctigrandis TaxID=2527986 RepID=A0A5C5YN69_9BACT|nr:VWA domain containing CoxE-like protein [Planctomycetes bacterium CA13]